MIYEDCEIIKYHDWSIEVYNTKHKRYRVWIDCIYKDFDTQEEAENFIDKILNLVFEKEN